MNTPPFKEVPRKTVKKLRTKKLLYRAYKTYITPNYKLKFTRPILSTLAQVTIYLLLFGLNFENMCRSYSVVTAVNTTNYSHQLQSYSVLMLHN